MRTRRWWVLAVLVAVTAGWGQEEDPQAAEQAYRQVDGAAQALIAQRRYDDAIQVCEHFLRQYPNVLPYSRRVAVTINQVVSRHLKDPRQRLAVWERAFEEFADSPDYYCYGAAFLVRELLQQKQPLEADALTAAALDTMGDALPCDYYLGYNLLLVRMQALRDSGQIAEALDFIADAAVRAPIMLQDDGFLRTWITLTNRQPDPERLLSMAKTAYLLAPVEGDSFQEAFKVVTFALTKTRGKDAVVLFQRAQADPAGDNPLREVTAMPLAETEALLAAAEVADQVDAQVSALLLADRVGEAVERARLLLDSATDERVRQQAVSALARCFKAHDLSLQRANEFLDAQAAGQTGPLDELAAELMLAL